MTNHGKCETCRQRKVKCDEKLPKCGACNKKGRICRYLNANDSIFIHEQVGPTQDVAGEQKALASTTELPSDSIIVKRCPKGSQSINTPRLLFLKRCWKAESGQGEFYTFARSLDSSGAFQSRITESKKPYRKNNKGGGSRALSPSPGPTLLCAQTGASACWGSIFGFEALDLNPLGSWVKAAWLWAGEDRFLDLASEYTLESMRAFQSGDQISKARACAVGERALQSLQSALKSQDDRKKRPKLVVAVMLHCAAEQFVNIMSFTYLPHVLGLSHLLETCLKEGLCDDTIRSVASLICVDETSIATIFGRRSRLEDLSCPPTPLTGPYHLDVALAATEHLLVQLPRLTLLVRSTIANPEDTGKRSNAKTLARELYTSDAHLYTQKTIHLHSKVILSSNKPIESPMPYVLDFDSLSAYVLATRYYLYRVRICGLIETLSNCDPNSSCFDTTILEQHDISAAASLAMCLEYALKPTCSRPLTALGMVIPLKAVLAAWLRLQKRQTSTKTEDYGRAIRMKAWSFACIQYLESVWGCEPGPYEGLEEILEIGAGGPLMDSVYNYERSDSIAMDDSYNGNEPRYSWNPGADS